MWRNTFIVTLYFLAIKAANKKPVTSFNSLVRGVIEKRADEFAVCANVTTKEGSQILLTDTAEILDRFIDITGKVMQEKPAGTNDERIILFDTFGLIHTFKKRVNWLATFMLDMCKASKGVTTPASANS